MGWAIGEAGGRDIGYGVPATCDYPTCKAIIDRGISYCCGSFRSDDGCGLYFCGKHLFYGEDRNGDTAEFCDVCLWNIKHDVSNNWKLAKSPYEPKPDRPVWIRHKLKHASWAEWRSENPDEVERLQQRLSETRRHTKGVENVKNEANNGGDIL